MIVEMLAGDEAALTTLSPSLEQDFLPETTIYSIAPHGWTAPSNTPARRF